MSLKVTLILSENWTMLSPRDLRTLVDWAVIAEEEGVDSVMISEHIALGPSADSEGRMANLRDYALPNNQDPTTPWPSSLILLSAIAARTTQIRLVAGALIAPLRHPVQLARDLATLDLLSEGRLIIIPTVSWHKDEYDALGVPFHLRGKLLDEHLAAWSVLWRETPASFAGNYYTFENVYLEPKPYRTGGPLLYFGGSTLHKALIQRIVQYGSGFNPLGSPAPADMERLAHAMRSAGREMSELEMVGGTRGIFSGPDAVADLAQSLGSIPRQVKAGYTNFCIKPSQFTDNATEIRSFCREAVKRIADL
jgi:probable F420-dependent oxidoreductase